MAKRDKARAQLCIVLRQDGSYSIALNDMKTITKRLVTRHQEVLGFLAAIGVAQPPSMTMYPLGCGNSMADVQYRLEISRLVENLRYINNQSYIP